jgi:hypothetical protein
MAVSDRSTNLSNDLSEQRFLSLSRFPLLPHPNYLTYLSNLRSDKQKLNPKDRLQFFGKSFEDLALFTFQLDWAAGVQQNSSENSRASQPNEHRKSINALP